VGHPQGPSTQLESESLASVVTSERENYVDVPEAALPSGYLERFGPRLVQAYPPGAASRLPGLGLEVEFSYGPLGTDRRPATNVAVAMREEIQLQPRQSVDGLELAVESPSQSTRIRTLDALERFVHDRRESRWSGFRWV
jgi:hypothetical protein